MPKTKKPKKLKREKWAMIGLPIYFEKYYYMVSNYGKVKRVDVFTGEVLMLRCSKERGGTKLNLQHPDGSCYYFVHRLVAMFFLKRKVGKQFVIHLDQNYENSRYDNLKWVSREELNEVWKERGCYVGNVHPNYKLKVEDIKKIRKLLDKGLSLKKIAEQFNVSDMQIHRIGSGENWSWVE